MQYHFFHFGFRQPFQIIRYVEDSPNCRVQKRRYQENGFSSMAGVDNVAEACFYGRNQTIF